MDENRRSFLRKAGCAALGLGCGLPVLGTGCALQEGHAKSSRKNQWAMVIDIQKCLEKKEVRDACIRACNLEHNVPFIPDPEDPEISDPEEGIHWIWEEHYEHVFPDQAHRHTAAAVKEAPVLVLCNHCTRPSCVKVCPTGATWKRKQDGIVMMDMHRCIGCRYCMAACPYGSRSFNWRDPREYIEKDEKGEFLSDYPTRMIGVVEKCDFCAERLREEHPRPPACVEAANEVEGGEGALTFGDLGDSGSEVNKILAEKHTICRRVSLGTGPNVFYIVRDQELGVGNQGDHAT